MNPYIAGTLAVVLTPFMGGLLYGLDRKLTARMQSRIGPPIVQPFYDVLKLFGKDVMSCNGIQSITASVYLVTSMLGVLMLALGQDLLVLLFVVALGDVMLILGAFSVKSPYSQLGAQRAIMQMLAYEPLLVLTVVGVYLKSGSFLVENVLQLDEPLFLSMPLFFVTQTMVLGIRLHKSPFDVSASHHAHQELVRGIYTEFSGPMLALIELAHFYEVVLLLGFIWLLFHTIWWIGLLLALASYFIVILLDNVTSRLTWDWLVAFTWTWGGGLAVLNLIFLYVKL
jgi:formate hydrogenlyase subunit 4